MAAGPLRLSPFKISMEGKMGKPVVTANHRTISSHPDVHVLSYLTVVFGAKCAPCLRGNDVVQVTDITLNGVSIATDASVFQRGKGMIIVSGTTHTYLPRTMAGGFSDAWEAATGSVSCPFASPLNSFVWGHVL